MILEDASGFQGAAASRVAPLDAAGVSSVLTSGAAVTVVGAGTGVTGGGVPLEGVALSLEGFRGLSIGQGSARVGAGVLLSELQAALRGSGQFYAPDPTHNAAALGGTIANNASGSRSFLYGSTRKHILSLQVAFADGLVREFARGDAIDFDVMAVRQPATTKHQAGYPLRPGMDWIDLICGSEGTLGVVLEATVRLLPAPLEVLAGVVFFPSTGSALEAVAAWRSIAGLRMLEYLDEASLRLLDVDFAAAALVVEQADADADAWLDRLEAAGALLEESWFGSSDADRERFRRFRHALPERVNSLVRQRGFMKMGTDYAVPVARLGEMMALYREGLSTFPGDAVIFGHIGDAHLHVNLMPASATEKDQAWELIHVWARQAVALGGTIGAEHGLGKRKAHLLPLQYSPAELEAMRAVKRRLDPEWILGRGTLFAAPPRPGGECRLVRDAQAELDLAHVAGAADFAE